MINRLHWGRVYTIVPLYSLAFEFVFSRREVGGIRRRPQIRERRANLLVVSQSTVELPARVGSTGPPTGCVPPWWSSEAGFRGERFCRGSGRRKSFRANVNGRIDGVGLLLWSWFLRGESVRRTQTGQRKRRTNTVNSRSGSGAI